MKNEKNIRKRITAILFAVVMIGSVLAVLASASISPDTLEAELSPCESITVDKEVHIEKPVKADVIFSFDLTGSMGGIIATAKSNASEIMTALNATGVDINYGVMSYMDYPHRYDSCGYNRMYGSSASGDYAYSLDQSLTSNRTAVNDTINALTLGSGADGPQDYTRIFYESYADPSVGWRPGAKRILVNFGDNVPHDCNLNEGVPGKTGIWTTGGDPGRDEIMGTADDLDLQAVLANMSANGTILLECHTTIWKKEYWDYWTNITGGNVSITGSATLVNDVVGAITAGLETPEVYGLHLAVTTSGFEDWLVSVVPDSYPVVSHCETVTFEETIHVPIETECGVYTFTVSAMDDKGVSYGDQTVTIDVPCPPSEIPVYVDIKPGSCPNPLNKKSKGVLPVAVLGTEDFDVTTIDPETIQLNREGIEDGVAPIRWSYEDVATSFEGELCDCHDLNGDGILDLTLKFSTQDLVEKLNLCPLDGQTIPLTITGNLKEENGGTPIKGEDCIWILKQGKK
ncbi:MAG TPA: hypothetical protein C5S37_11440 [Methanophagales archaeon]|nr:hypothetical protein [Methanophagales archaeon]